MEYDRRGLIRLTGAAAVGAATGCIGGEDDGGDANPEQASGGDDDGTPDTEETSTDGSGEEGDGGGQTNPELGAAAGLNVLRTRLYDAVALGRAGETDAAAEEASDVFAYFEEAGGEYGVHEFVEATDEDAYEGFEESLGALRTALEDGDSETAAEEAASADEHIANVQSTAVSEDAAGVLGFLVLASRLYDARFVSAAGGSAGDVGTRVFSAFEQAPFHDAVSEANTEAYEAFESAMGDVADGDTGRASDAFGSAVDAAYSMSEEAAHVGYVASTVSRAHDTRLVSTAGDDGSSLMSDVFAGWEEARAHEAVEEADGEAYEAFEGALDGYVNAIGGDGVDDALSELDEAATRARFALVDASEEAPVGESGSHGDEHDHGGETELSGGPNVGEGEPDADHVVDMTAVAYEPETVEISQGDTVAWVHAGGEPHTVTAYGDGIPDDAGYWASGDFSSEQAAREGWENGEGAVQDGEYYERAFETTGTHEYVCIPHEAAGMVGEVVVE
jgi:plastocyanin